MRTASWIQQPAGFKNANKTRIDDVSDATLAAVCADLDLAPAVVSEGSVKEQRMRCIHAASGSTAKLPTCGQDMERQVYIDRILAGLPA